MSKQHFLTALYLVVGVAVVGVALVQLATPATAAPSDLEQTIGEVEQDLEGTLCFGGASCHHCGQNCGRTGSCSCKYVWFNGCIACEKASDIQPKPKTDIIADN